MPSRFDRDTIREYFEHCQRTGLKRVGSVLGLTEHAYKTGNNDLEIKAWLFPDDNVPRIICPTCNGTGRVPEPVKKPEPPCHMCGDKKQLVRFNPATREDEIFPCTACTEEGRKLKFESLTNEQPPAFQVRSAAPLPLAGLLPAFAQAAIASVQESSAETE